MVRPVEAIPLGRLAYTEATTLSPGGCALNTALVLQRLGLQCGLAGRVGDDHLGRFLLDACDLARVNRQGVIADPTAPTAATVVLVAPSGERTFLHTRGANAEFRLADVPRYAPRWFHYGGALLMPRFDGTSAAQALKAARDAGARTSVVPVWDPDGNWEARLEPLWRYTDLLVASATEAERLTGEPDPPLAAQALVAKGVGCVAVTSGARGALVGTRDQSLVVPAIPVSVVDETGAGDCFAAGLIAGLLWGYPLERAARVAAACGALAVTALGATTGIASRRQVEALAPLII